MKYCQQCGTPCEDTAKFCTQCGSSLEQQNMYQNTQGDSYNAYSQNTYEQNPRSNPEPSYYAPNTSGIESRSIVTAVILSIITCGIYGIYWMIKLNDEINQVSGETEATSGGIVFLLSLVTCGIYGIYWNYKMGERCDRIKGSNQSSAILYLILALFGFGIINYCLMQDTLNKAVS